MHECISATVRCGTRFDSRLEPYFGHFAVLTMLPSIAADSLCASGASSGVVASPLLSDDVEMPASQSLAVELSLPIPLLDLALVLSEVGTHIQTAFALAKQYHHHMTAWCLRRQMTSVLVRPQGLCRQWENR